MPNSSFLPVSLHACPPCSSPRTHVSVRACVRAHLVVFPVHLGDHGDEGEAHERDQSQPPGEAEHEHEEAHRLHRAAQEDVDVDRHQVAHLGGVRRQPGRDVT